MRPLSRPGSLGIASQGAVAPKKAKPFFLRPLARDLPHGYPPFFMQKTNYAILRLRKLRSFGQISATGRHNSRQGKTPNADTTKTPSNRELVANENGITSAVKARLPEKVRKNAVLGIEALFATSAPIADIHGWAKKSLAWAQARWGAENIVSCTLHLDEKTPHLHLVFVPLRNGKLQGKAIVGNRATLTAMQDSYHKEVSEYGLARGNTNPLRRHIPPHRLREHNATADETERAEAVAEVKLLRAELASLRRQLSRERSGDQAPARPQQRNFRKITPAESAQTREQAMLPLPVENTIQPRRVERSMFPPIRRNQQGRTGL